MDERQKAENNSSDYMSLCDTVAVDCSGYPHVGESWDRIGTEIVSMRFISVHIGSLTVRLQPEYNVIVISNFQLDSVIGHPTENPFAG